VQDAAFLDVAGGPAKKHLELAEAHGCRAALGVEPHAIGR